MSTVNVNFSHSVTQVTLQTDDMDLAGDVIQSLASYLGIEVYTAVNCVVMETPGGTVIHISAEMNSTIFEYPCNSVIGPHMMFHVVSNV